LGFASSSGVVIGVGEDYVQLWSREAFFKPYDPKPRSLKTDATTNSKTSLAQKPLVVGKRNRTVMINKPVEVLGYTRENLE